MMEQNDTDGTESKTRQAKSHETRPRGYKKYFMLHSAEHEILNAHKYKFIKKFSFFRLR